MVRSRIIPNGKWRPPFKGGKLEASRASDNTQWEVATEEKVFLINDRQDERRIIPNGKWRLVILQFWIKIAAESDNTQWEVATVHF